MSVNHFLNLEKNQELKGYIGPAVNDLLNQLRSDRYRGHIDSKAYSKITDNLKSLVISAADLDYENVKKFHTQLKASCQYNRKICSKWNLLGLAIGAFFEGMGLLAITLLTKGAAAIPMWAIGLNIGSVGFLGALFGHKIGQYHAKRKSDLLVGESVYRYFEAKEHKDAPNLKNFSIFNRIKEKFSQCRTPAQAPKLQ